MDIEGLLAEGKTIWKDEERLGLSKIIVRMGKVLGDIFRWERNAAKDKATHTDNELKKELGNIAFSTLRWCDAPGYDHKECIRLAIDCQKKFQK